MQNCRHKGLHCFPCYRQQNACWGDEGTHLRPHKHRVHLRLEPRGGPRKLPALALLPSSGARHSTLGAARQQGGSQPAGRTSAHWSQCPGAQSKGLQSLGLGLGTLLRPSDPRAPTCPWNLDLAGTLLQPLATRSKHIAQCTRSRLLIPQKRTPCQLRRRTGSPRATFQPEAQLSQVLGTSALTPSSCRTEGRGAGGPAITAERNEDPLKVESQAGATFQGAEPAQSRSPTEGGWRC